MNTYIGLATMYCCFLCTVFDVDIILDPKHPCKDPDRMDGILHLDLNVSSIDQQLNAHLLLQSKRISIPFLINVKTVF